MSFFKLIKSVDVWELLKKAKAQGSLSLFLEMVVTWKLYSESTVNLSDLYVSIWPCFVYVCRIISPETTFCTNYFSKIMAFSLVVLTWKKWFCTSLFCFLFFCNSYWLVYIRVLVSFHKLTILYNVKLLNILERLKFNIQESKKEQ